ncbi:MAG: tetratricopeptide repeat protein [Verrucomicrobiota bacterium]|nr:tetratricopeptide repeat protein [Verrucomicrobiota bacterium]
MRRRACFHPAVRLLRPLLWLALTLPLSTFAARTTPGKWEKLENAVLGDGYMDGDSFHIRHNNRNIIIRLYFVDVPESDATHVERNQEQADYFNVPLARVIPIGKKAAQFTKKTLGGKKFTVWTRWQDAMGSSSQKRYFGYVRLGKEDLGELLAANGLARVYGASTVSPEGETVNAQFEKLRQLERRAKAKRLGGWAKQKKGQDDTVEGMFDAALDELDDAGTPAWLEDEEDVGVYGDKWPNVPIVAFLRAEVFINTEQFEDAEIEMRKLVRRFPEHPQKARIEFYLALSIAMQERFEEAVERFQAWLRTYPDHMLVPDVQYWLPISYYYDGRFEQALPLFENYGKHYPMSVYAPEATYRAACCLYAMEDYERCARDLRHWLQQHPDHYFRFEATIMLGDALAVLGNLAEAKEAYRAAMVPAAGPFYYMALTQIARVYKALAEEEDFQAMAADYVQFIKDMPNDGNIIDAAYNAGWALRQLKRNDQARNLYWQMIERHGNTPAWEGFDLMLDDLAGMYPRNSGDYAKELRARYDRALADRRLTLASRLAWAEARMLPADQQARQLALFSGRFTADYLGAETLAWLGEAWINNGMEANGISNLELLLEKYPDSRHVPQAQTLLAEQALANKEYSTALVLADTVLNNAAEIQYIMDATFYRAEALRGLERYADAIEDYNAILANRAAPRHLKPEALLGIAASLEAQQEYAQAIPYYQRIYVLYGAYRNAVIQAYLRSGVCFERLHEPQKAIQTYREFLASDYAAGTAAASQARQRLAALSGGAP